ncbi:signal recognition particle-docking protein FtsY [Yimella sp. cx-51]|uniref:signal recognition particle-docking protein FtsY n=1 Tax=Yimella sp. cx-51 TaxID=2770551 RepID=UPI00165D9608|nr:signal recognition particle-docking protein FtsY [Yimella sp. cx-51]MBC9956741.1 signal recognition particle-docking protein FtsY [Yimella sp. cx-51]QTH38977.1 signal recognition particle-docking protein FtsY [Yimella sp. cx-51]
MDQIWEFLVVITVVVLGALGFALAFLRGRGGKTKELPPQTPPPAAKDAPQRGANTYRPSSTATIDTSKGAAPPTAPPADMDERDEAPVVSPTAPAVENKGSTAVQEPPAEPVIVEPLEPALEQPESARGRMTRLRSRLAASNNSMGKGLLGILSSGTLDETVWEEVEDTLLGADLGVEATTELVDNLKKRVKVEGSATPEQLETWLHEELLALVNPDMDRRIAASRQGDRPAVVMVVGVNGTGKTTTVGKLARVLVAEDKEVLLGAADTFRAAAADQLETWGARVGVATVRSDKEGADPAAVAFDAVKAGMEEEADVVLIDTAGRLHNKVGLMDELAKVKRVIEKQSPIDECLLVLDATTGQNGMRQAEVFAQAVNITGVVLTKLDGTAKGGIVVLVQRELGVPVKLVGLGEGADDLAPFDAKAFVDAVLD